MHKPFTTIYKGRFIPNPITGEVDTACDDEVTVDGVLLSPKPSQRIHNHSPDGFSWGYGGSGPAQLALAILYDFTGEKQTALLLYQRFKGSVVAQWPQAGGWEMTGRQIGEWLTAEIRQLEIEAIRNR